MTKTVMLRNVILALGIFVGFGCATGVKKDSREGRNNSDVSPDLGDSDTNSETQDGMASQNEDQSKKSDATVVNKSTNPDLYKKFNQARSSHQTRAALEAAGELLARNPGDAGVLNALSSFYIELDKYDLARLVTTKVLEKNQGNSSALNNLGIIELKQGNLRLALVNFKKATETDPSNRFAHGNLGSIYLQYRNYPNAAAELQAAVDHGDQSVAAYSNLGFALAEIGRYDDAANAYDKALAKDSGNLNAMTNYAVLLIQDMGNKEKGLKLLNKIRFVAHEPAILEKVEALTRIAEAPKKSVQEKGAIGNGAIGNGEQSE
jgi:tetratricopeptide (TPR) repeat protein